MQQLVDAGKSDTSGVTARSVALYFILLGATVRDINGRARAGSGAGGVMGSATRQ